MDTMDSSMRTNPQGGDMSHHPDGYRRVLDNIETRMADRQEISIANFGSGQVFEFETALKDRFKNRVIMNCIDLNIPVNIPSFINFTKGNVEEKIQLDNKMDVVCFFELIEHIDKTDELLKNCYNNLKDDNGYLICSCPNLSSFWSRLELLLGFQPHLLEASNEYHLAGMGIFGRRNYGEHEALHHIRGLTYRAQKDLLEAHGFEIEKIYGYTSGKIFHIPSLASDVLFICRKVDRKSRIK